MTSRHKVLFVGHDATRTGAPRVLLEFVRWLRCNTSLQFEIVLHRGGPLTGAFVDIARTHVLQSDVSRFPLGYRLAVRALGNRRAGDRLASRPVRSLTRIVRSFAPDLVYVNSAAAAPLLTVRPPFPLIAHIHEMEYGLRCAFQTNADLLDWSNRVIAASESVAEDLERRGVARRSIDVIPAFIAGTARALGCARASGDPATVVGSGSRVWQKGPDLFIELAAQVRRRLPERTVRFVWIGGHSDADPATSWQLELDMRRIGQQGSVDFIDEVNDPRPAFAAADIFALTSREDSFPLACLEAAAVGTPVVCFASSGIRDLAAHGGAVVPHLDVSTMADVVVSLLQDDARRQRLAAKAQELAARYEVGVVAPQLLEVIERTINRT